MNHLLYSYSLCAALPLMLFIGYNLIFAKTPDKAIFENYVRSRRIIGAALLLLSANYAVHLFFGIRFLDTNAAILMNMSTYFMCYWLFSSALISLLDKGYITAKRTWIHGCMWVLFSALSGVVLMCLHDGAVQKAFTIVMAVCLIAYGIVLAIRVLTTYHRAVKMFDETHSDNIGAYVRWLSIFTYWALIFGVGCGILTFLPNDYVFIWVLSSIPFYMYLYCSYQNYLLFYEQVETAIEEETPASEETEPVSQVRPEEYAQPASYAVIAEKVIQWIEKDGYTCSGLTLLQLSETLRTNRTYLSGYIKATYGQSFREWITDLRVEYAKKLLAEYPEMTVSEVSEKSGFQSQSHFFKLFRSKENCSPAKWRKNV